MKFQISNLWFLKGPWKWIQICRIIYLFIYLYSNENLRSYILTSNKSMWEKKIQYVFYKKLKNPKRLFDQFKIFTHSLRWFIETPPNHTFIHNSFRCATPTTLLKSIANLYSKKFKAFMFYNLVQACWGWLFYVW
jgi:hypothetical protein